MSTPASKAYVLSFGGYLVDDLTVSPTLSIIILFTVTILSAEVTRCRRNESSAWQGLAVHPRILPQQAILSKSHTCCCSWPGTRRSSRWPCWRMDTGQLRFRSLLHHMTRLPGSPGGTTRS